MKKFNITKQFLEKEYINNKKTIRQIAKEINCSHSNISFHFEKYNVSRRSRGEAIDKWSSILTKNFLEREYVSNKNSAYEMAKIMGCAVATFILKNIIFLLELIAKLLWENIRHKNILRI